MVELAEAERRVAEVAAQRRGSLRAEDVAAAGVTPAAMAHLRRRGVVVSVGKGVDRMRDRPLDHGTRCQLALDLAGPGAVLGGRTAARLRGLHAYRDFDEIEVLVRRGRDQRTALGRVLQTGWLPDEHVSLVDGLPVTTVARTFFDLCARPPHRWMSVNHPLHEKQMRIVYNDCLRRRGMSFVQEAAVLLVMAKRGRPGTCLVRRILERYGADYEPTDSDLEEIYLQFLESYGFPKPELHVNISGENGWIGTVDTLWRDAMVVVEIDSSFHDGPMDKEVDEDRDVQLRRAGYEIQRIRYGHIVLHPAETARQLGVLLRSRTTASPPGSTDHANRV